MVREEETQGRARAPQTIVLSLIGALVLALIGTVVTERARYQSSESIREEDRKWMSSHFLNRIDEGRCHYGANLFSDWNRRASRRPETLRCRSEADGAWVLRSRRRGIHFYTPLGSLKDPTSAVIYSNLVEHFLLPYPIRADRIDELHLNGTRSELYLHTILPMAVNRAREFEIVSIEKDELNCVSSKLASQCPVLKEILASGRLPALALGDKFKILSQFQVQFGEGVRNYVLSRSHGLIPLLSNLNMAAASAPLLGRSAPPIRIKDSRFKELLATSDLSAELRIKAISINQVPVYKHQSLSDVVLKLESPEELRHRIEILSRRESMILASFGGFERTESSSLDWYRRIWGRIK